MLVTRTQKLTLTLLFHLTLAFIFSATANASSHTHRGIAEYSHKRLIKKRAAFSEQDSSVDRAAADKKAKADSDDTEDSILGFPLRPLSGAASNPPDANASASLSQSLSASASASASVSESLSASASVSTTNSTSASVTQSSTSSAPPVDPTPSDTTHSVVTQVTTTQITQVTESAQPKDNTNLKANNGSLSEQTKHTLLTVVIVVAASIAGIAIIWTVFRKWKLGRSSKFDSRLQPIDWQPTHNDEADFRSHRNSGMSYSSGYGATSERGHGALQPLPDHDFTAGAAHLAPVGGYADLSRGPSPQPYMQENMRSGSNLNGGNYNNGVPLHHQGYGGHY